MPKKYLVRVKIYSSQTDVTINQYYAVNKKTLAQLKTLDIENDGSCCGQGGCIACTLSGIRLKYHSHLKINKDTDIAVVNFVCHNQFYKIDELLNYEDSCFYKFNPIN